MFCWLRSNYIWFYAVIVQANCFQKTLNENIFSKYRASRQRWYKACIRPYWKVAKTKSHVLSFKKKYDTAHNPKGHPTRLKPLDFPSENFHKPFSHTTTIMILIIPGTALSSSNEARLWFPHDFFLYTFQLKNVATKAAFASETFKSPLKCRTSVLEPKIAVYTIRTSEKFSWLFDIYEIHRKIDYLKNKVLIFFSKK